LATKPENATPYHLEGYLNIKVSDNINITPGLVVLFKPEGFESSNTVVMPVIRTTFKI
jgi:carbohydrate-selective porin OprB